MNWTDLLVEKKKAGISLGNGNETIGSILKERMRVMRIDQFALASMIGLDPSTVRAYMKDKSVPGLITAHKIAKILEISLDEWMDAVNDFGEVERYERFHRR